MSIPDLKTVHAPHANVYHFTDTARLPWIFVARELRPGRYKTGVFPDTDFLWATTSAAGERTASCASGSSVGAYRDGVTRLVRFTLRREDFTPWCEALRASPAWTAEHVQLLARAAAGESSPGDWHCRAEPLPLDQVVAIATRSYRDNKWKPLLTRTLALLPDDMPGDPLGVVIDGDVYVSTPRPGPGGVAGYVCMKITAHEYTAEERG